MMRPLVLAAVVLVGLPAPAGAQETTPPQPHATPRTEGPCPQLRVDGPRTVAPGATAHYTAVVTGGSIPYRWTVLRTAPGPETVVGGGTSEYHFSFLLTVAETSSYRVEATAYSGCAAPGHGTAELTVQTSADCPVTRTPSWQTVGPNAPVPVAATVAAATATVRLRRTDPAPAAVVRQGTGDQAWQVRVPESTVLSLEGADGCPAQQLRLLVRPVVTLTAVRRAPRDYAFSGRVTPGRGQALTLYRVEASGRRVAAARTTVAPDGSYRFDRRFTGSGRYGFVVTLDPGSAGRTLPGESAVRPTVVH